MTRFFSKAIAFPVLLISVALVIFASSCTKDDTGTVSISLSESSVSSASGSVTVTVQCPGSWIILVTSDGWATVSPATGSGNGQSTLTYDPNKSSEARTATLTLTGSGNSVSCTLTQAAYSASDTDNRQGVDVTGCSWMELPATYSGDGLSFYTHDQTIDNTITRNYSFYWDKTNHLSHWVAYPLNAWLIGTGSRANEPFDYDPYVPEDEQAALNLGSYTGDYDRGHQCASADRYYYDANVATFYATNMTPQGSNFNQKIWSNVESKVRTWSKASGTDTLYVVTGCVIDGYTSTTTDKKGMTCPIPVAYWKAVLRYSKTDTSVGYSHYLGCAVYLDHHSYSDDTFYSTYTLSIDALEEKLGIDLFVNLPNAIGDEDAAKVEAQDPTTVDWWNLTAPKE